MNTDKSSTAANYSANYTLAKVNAGDACDYNPQVSEATEVTGSDYRIFNLTLTETVCSISYRIEVNANVTDRAVPTPNPMGTPRILTFAGNEQLKVVSAEGVDKHTVRVTFNKAVNPGINQAGSAGCTGDTECSYRYKFDPDLGDITGATVNSNVVTITHANEQTGGQYTVIAANDLDGDGFSNSGWGSIQSANAPIEDVQAAPRDRAPFQGQGNEIDTIEEGEYFSDPFGDATSFAFAFVYADRVYLGPNETNQYFFRFDPNGTNAVLVANRFSGTYNSLTPLGSSTGFGWDADGDGAIEPADGDYRGYYGETGVVGFNSVSLDLGGTEDDEILVPGPYNPSGFATYPVYFTDDRDTELDWRFLTFSGTGGGNTRAIQFVYGTNDNSGNAYVYLGASSDQDPQAPVVSIITVQKVGDVISQSDSDDMTFRNVPYMGTASKLGSSRNQALTDVYGIDSAINFNGHLYVGNNGDVRYSSDYFAFSSNSSTIRGRAGYTGTTLALPTVANGGLGQIRPGLKGVPRLLEFHGKLYMARNVSTAAGEPHQGNATPLRGELWQCDPGGNGICEPAEWNRIIYGTENELKTDTVVTAKSISLLEAYGNILYIGFDDTDTSQGVRIFRIAGTDPAPTNGTNIVGQGGGAGWVQLGVNGIGSNYMQIISSTTISDGTDNYLYLTAKKTTGDTSIRVFRQKN